jgi:hypothetical protein
MRKAGPAARYGLQGPRWTWRAAAHIQAKGPGAPTSAIPASLSREPAIVGACGLQPCCARVIMAAPEPPIRPVRAPRLRARERERVKETAEFCADVLADGSWEQAVADRLTDLAGDAWQRLKRSRRRHRRNCKKLAQMARTILKAQDQIHRLAGELATQGASVADVRGPALDFTRELVKRIPIGPVDAKLTAAARTIQIAGIALCLMNGRDLTRCECFIDLALAETKQRVSQILDMRLTNWAELSRIAENRPAPQSLD